MNKIDLNMVMLRLGKYGMKLLLVVTMFLSAQQAFSQASSYAFVASTTTWTEITGGTPSTALGDDGTEVVNLPIPFLYNGGLVSQVTISTNGFLRLAGGSIFSSSWTNDLANTARTPVAAPYWDDHHLVAGTGTIQYTVTGVAPSRKFVVQWKDVTTSGSGSSASTTKASFQVALSEGSNVIELIYGPSDAGTFSGSIGINSAPGGAGNFLSITPGAPATSSSTTAANSLAVPPASGTVYSFTPPSASTISSAASGLWSNPATWNGGAIPNFASTVTIAGGHSITVDLSPTVASLTVGNGTSNDSLLFNGAAVRSLSVNGGITIAANAVMTTTPTTGTNARNIFLGGDFTNNGTADLSSNGTLLAFAGTAVQVLGGTGTFSNAATIREIQVSSGLTINTPINVSARLTMVDGLLTTNNNLSMDNTLGGVVTGGVTFRRSVVSPAIVGAVNVGATALYNLDYVVFTGQVTPVVCSTGTEIPASRTINGIRLAGGTGTQLVIAGGNLTMTSGSTSTSTTFPNTATAPGALIFSSGVYVVPSGSEMILSNGALANITGGGATAYIQGKLTWTVNSTSAQTRNFRVGNGLGDFLVVLGGLNTAGSAQTFSVELGGAPSGTAVAPVTEVMGTRTARVTSNAALPATTTLQLNWTANDGLNLGAPAELRVVQSNAVNGSWTERSVSTTAGTLAGTGNRTTTAGIDLANGEYFGFGTTAGAQVAVVSVSSPGNEGCYSATETVRAVLRNTGGTLSYAANNVTVRGSVSGPTGTITNLTAVVRSSGSLAAGGTDTIVFTPTVNFTLQGTHTVEIFIDSIVGQSLTGDTLRASVRSTVYTVVVTPSTILVGDSAVVSVSSPDGLRFSEFTHFYSGTGQTGVNYPAYVTSSTTDPDLLEISNFSGLSADMSGFQLEIVGTGARTYSFPANTVLAPGAVMIVHIGSGTDLPANNFYNTGGSNGALSSSSNAGYILRDPSGFIVDAVAMNSFSFAASTGVTAADWSGSMGSASGRAGASLASPDNNTGSAWVIANSPAPLQTIGTLNPGFIVSPATVSWSGPGGFTATGPSVSTGPRSVAGQETYTATISVNGCSKSSSGILQVIIPVAPDAGFTVSDTVATVGGVVSTITLTDTSLNIPSAWKWTVTPNNVVFVNNTTDSSALAQIQFTAPGSYSVKLRVSNIAGADSLTYSTPIVVSLVYCASGATSTADTKIDSVILGSTITGTAQNVCQSYSNFTDSLGVAATIVKTQPFAMSVKSGYCGSSAYTSFGRVFVDLNKDGNFTANESVADFGPLSATGFGAAREWFNMNLVVPVSADTGITRLRIVYQETFSANAISGCGTYGYGETEDYLVRITNPVVANPVLASPSNNAFLNVNGLDQVQVNINWTPATRFTGTAAPASYIWQLASRTAGNFNAPLLSIASNNAGADTALTLSLGQLDQALASLSVAVGDTVRGIWRVRAISGTDTVFSAQTWNIDIRRGTVTEAVTAFSLVTPPNNTILSVEGPGSQTAQIRWTTPVVAGSAPITYQWLAIAPNGNFNAPLVTLNANGSDTSLTLSYTAIDALLASLNVNVGDSARLDWTVRVNSGTFTRLATQTWRITMVRGGIAPLRFAIAPVANGGTTGLRAPNGTSAHTFFRAASFVPASELAAAGIQNGAIITAFALRTTAGADAPARGKMSLYLSNGQNATYTRGTAWTGAITGLNLHHDDSVSIQTGAGTMLLQFSQPFVYTGGSIELAYEWNGSAPFATVAAVYAANTAIGGSLVSGASATAAPATLGATAFRPEFTWGVDDRKANEIEVITMFAKGRNPLNYGTPEVVQAIVRNNGYQVRNNVPVTLSVAGPNNFTQFNVQTITRLAIDATQLVTFSPINGSTLGYNNMTVSVPADDVAANNAKTWAQEQTDSIFSYNDSVTVGNSSVGYNTGSGLLLSRFSINGTRSIAAARIRIGDGAAIAGNSVSAVVLNESGVIVSQSAPVALTAADLRTWVVFPFTAPANVTNGNFYIGLAQTANATTGYFPVAFQAETPTRANAYFTAPLAGGVVPSPVAGFRLMIEAHVGAPFVPADTLSRFNLVAPSNNTTLNIQGDPTQTAQIRWRTSTRTGGIGTTTYQWLLDVPAGDFSNPVLRVNAGTDTSLTLTYGQIVDSLAAKGVQVGSGFAGRWNVLATNGPVSRLANIPFIITLNRGVMTSIEETDFSKSISLYPNPAAYSAKLQINTPGDRELSIVIVNAVGQEMKKFNVSSSIANDIELDLTSLNQGLYFVRVTNGSEMAIKRLMIQR